ncbi:hypothetical protein C3F09_08695 [candidate division GN15 bacterium]|uniref:HAD family hydrolase n=1 Tax=candidate division GN15 bacterium TaxID=2072418 RepID=A0A855X440_9BACT|nr:MAG: hypothetical protein C3F09_08695 [candidate division GN15 bacterium]
MEKLRPKAVIFDLGSTLIEYEVVSWDELNRLCASSARDWLANEGYDVPEEAAFHTRFEDAKFEYRKAASESLVEWNVPMVAEPFLREIGLAVQDGFVDRFFDAYYAPVDRLLYVYPDTLDTLRWIKGRGLPIGLVSNTVFPERAHRRELTRFEIEPLLDFAIFSSTFKLRKPHPEIFRHASALAGVSPQECVYVGDRYVEDIVGPNGVGMPAILRAKEGREYPPDMPGNIRRIRTLSELPLHLDI